MPWTNIEERLKRPFGSEMPLHAGSLWFPSRKLDIDQWLVSAAESDEELRELEIPRIRFLENRWRMEELFDIERERRLGARTAWALHIGHRAYIIVSDGPEYRLAALLEPDDNPLLYREAAGRIWGEAGAGAAAGSRSAEGFAMLRLLMTLLGPGIACRLPAYGDLPDWHAAEDQRAESS